MQKTALVKTIRYVCFVLALTAVALGLFCLTYACREQSEVCVGEGQEIPFTVVIDAGHGGEDGGTESADGVYEKDLNLEIAFDVKELLEAAGVRVIMTRSEDVLLYDRNVDYKGRKKVLDLAARLSVGESVRPDLFISVHMNAFPDSRYSGLQVWYSPNTECSEEFAKAIQERIASELQPENHRRVKAAGSNIFLLDRLTCPAVLVECGFLSNPTEAERLSDGEYQKQLSFLLVSSILESLEKEAANP